MAALVSKLNVPAHPKDFPKAVPGLQRFARWCPNITELILHGTPLKEVDRDTSSSSSDARSDAKMCFTSSEDSEEGVSDYGSSEGSEEWMSGKLHTATAKNIDRLLRAASSVATVHVPVAGWLANITRLTLNVSYGRSHQGVWRQRYIKRC